MGHTVRTACPLQAGRPRAWLRRVPLGVEDSLAHVEEPHRPLHVHVRRLPVVYRERAQRALAPRLVRLPVLARRPLLGIPRVVPIVAPLARAALVDVADGERLAQVERLAADPRVEDGDEGGADGAREDCVADDEIKGAGGDHVERAEEDELHERREDEHLQRLGSGHHLESTHTCSGSVMMQVRVQLRVRARARAQARVQARVRARASSGRHLGEKR